MERERERGMRDGSERYDERGRGERGRREMIRIVGGEKRVL